MKKLNIPLIPIITGAAALVAVAAVIIILTSAGGNAGLYVTSANGSVSITNSDNSSADGTSGEVLSQGDIISVGDNSSFTITYKSNKNSEDNYIVVGANSQLVITDKLNGKNSGELYLNRGSLICNLADNDKAVLYIRTADTMVYPDGSVSKIAYTTDGFEAYTDIYTFMGNSKIQLYDAQGNAVNGAELLIEKRAGRVTTNDLGPVFSYLNVEFPLTELTSSDLKELITIANLVDGFPYTVDELKAVYDAMGGDNEETVSESESETASDTSDVIQTAEPIVTTTSPLVVEPPSTAPKPQQTTAQQTTTTQPSQTTTSKPAETTAANTNQTFTVVVAIDGEETVYEVKYGGSVEKPADPVVAGKKFIGWDNSFDNITKDTTINAIFEDTAPTVVYHTVTIKIADKTTTIQVEDGKDAPLPSTITLDGYIFRGWDTNYTNVKSDITVTAILETVSTTCNVKFIISGVEYNQVVERGGTAIPPFTPSTDINGNTFLKWDKSLTNITSDTVITAIFGKEYYTVTFVVDGVSYPVTVKSGEQAVPPFTPTTNSLGQQFMYWDGSFYSVSSDMTITAVFY